ncbi:MAG TPA: hypothetical protein PLI09_15020 [Candidatus Hydrogenedentes bacterium]|nr:hypothetical protein [Candidatus Hydrogenedentota bacterium]
MPTPRTIKTLDWVNAIALWLALAFSLGWYYTFTYYGRSGWPMPSMEGCGGLLFYYFSVINVRVELQAVHWMLAFPLGGILWVALLSFTAPYFNQRNQNFAWSLVQFGLASLPLSLPGPYMAYLAGKVHGVWNIHTMAAVALRHDGAPPFDWLTPLYLGLGVAAFVCHLYAYRQVFPLRGNDAWKHFLLTASLYICTIVGLANIVAGPLRYFLEQG